MTAELLMLSSAGIALVLGLIHGFYTFTGSNLLPRNPDLTSAMNTAHLSITRETTVLRAWIGFNASHSMGLILFGLVFGFLALKHSQILFDSTYLLAVGFAMLLGFIVLARLYWFSVPFACISVALVGYVASIVAARI